MMKGIVGKPQISHMTLIGVHRCIQLLHVCTSWTYLHYFYVWVVVYFARTHVNLWVCSGYGIVALQWTKPAMEISPSLPPPPQPSYLLYQIFDLAYTCTYSLTHLTHSFVHTFTTIATPFILVSTMGSGIWVLYFSPAHLFKNNLILDKEIYMLF